MVKMMKSGKRKRSSKNSTTPESQVEEPKAVALAPVVGAGKNGTLAACIKRPRIEGKDSATRSTPTEIIFNILLLIPASILRDIMRFVCKEWNAIISDPLFIRAHLCRSLSSSSSHRLGLGFLVQDQCLRDTMSKQAFYIHTNGNGNGNDATGTGYSCTKIKLPYKAIIMGSCNGLVLLLNSRTRKARKDMFVVNLVTRAKTMLPSLSRSRVRIMYIPYTALAFAPSSGQYKVVYVSFASKNKKPAYVKNYCVEQLWTELEVKVMVCTIGVDQTWRAIDCKGITMSDEVKRTLMSQPFSNSSAGGHGHIYWFHKHYTCGLALDVDAETMYQFAGPKDYLMTYSSPMSLRMDTDSGVGLGMVHVRVPARLWKVWELIEPKTGTWSQATDIDVACMNSALRSHFNPCRFDFSAPLLLSLKRGEFWVLCVVGAKYRLACYNWKTGNIWSPSIIWPDCLDIPHLHINSLLSLKNL